MKLPATATPSVADVVSGRDYWIAQALGWGGLTVISIAASSFGSLENTLRFAAAKAFCMFTGLCLSHLWRGALRRHGWFSHRRSVPWQRTGAVLLAMSVLQTGAVLLADLAFRHGALVHDPELGLTDLIGLTLVWLAVFVLWTLCYAMAQARRRAVRFELEKLQLEITVKDAELRALQAQVNPHFFFNSLNSIRALIYADQDGAADAVSKLAGMMRHNLQAGQAATVRLADELLAVDAYLGMEKLRFDERLQLERDIAPGLEKLALPPMLLQTLVENAVKHGVERSAGPCRIRISAQRDGQRVLLQVANEGRLATASGSTRLGLANAARRLALLFGEHASCTLAEQDGWVVASVVLPCEAP